MRHPEVYVTMVGPKRIIKKFRCPPKKCAHFTPLEADETVCKYDLEGYCDNYFAKDDAVRAFRRLVLERGIQ